MKQILFLFTLVLCGQMPAQTNCNPVYREIQCPAQFPGGRSSLEDWISLSRSYYPTHDKEVVGIIFNVDTTGKPCDIHLLKAAAEREQLKPSEQEAIRLVASMPHWQPARSGPSCAVKVCEQVILPVVFYPKGRN